MFTPLTGDSPHGDRPDGVLRYLAGPIRSIREALDEGVALADTIFGTNGLDYDPHLWAHIVRCKAHQKLHKLTKDDHWSPGQPLPNSGIEVVKGGFRVRTLKRQGENPPAPGHNRSRKEFWGQGRQKQDQYHQLRISGWSLAAAESFEGANLILDWAVDDDRSVLLALSKPVGLWAYRGQPKLEWRQPVPLDADMGMVFEPADEDGLDVQFDRDEFLGDEEAEGGETGT